MLGRLAKWLRVIGYDTFYQPSYKKGAIGELVREGRTLLSRHRPTISQYSNSLLIRSDHVKDQLREMKSLGLITFDSAKWFSRCLICNVHLEETNVPNAHENVPEYVLYQNISGIRFCPSCGRCFWQGSHRKRMIRHLEEWGF